MARIGMLNVVAAKLKTTTYGEMPTYEQGFRVGRAIEGDINLEATENKLYADNRVVNIDKTVTNATMTLGVDEFGDGTELSQAEVKALLTGSVKETENGIEIISAGSTPNTNTVGVGFITTGRYPIDNLGVQKDYYEVHWYYKVTFGGMGNDKFNTKGENITWSTPTITGEITGVDGFPANKNLAKEARFDTENDATVWLFAIADIDLTEAQLNAAGADVLYTLCVKYSITSVSISGTDTPITSAASITDETKSAVVAAILTAQDA